MITLNGVSFQRRSSTEIDRPNVVKVDYEIEVGGVIFENGFGVSGECLSPVTLRHAVASHGKIVHRNRRSLFSCPLGVKPTDAVCGLR